MEGRQRPSLVPGAVFQTVGGSPKGLPPTVGIGSMGAMADDFQTVQLRGGWRAASEASRADEVCRHLEWARGMKASYERQVQQCEQEMRELRHHEQQRAPKPQQRMQRASSDPRGLPHSPPGGCSPERPGSEGRVSRHRKRSRAAHFSRRTQDDEVKYLNRGPIELRGQVPQPATPSSAVSAVSQGRHVLNLVKLPALRTPCRQVEGGNLRAETGSPTRLRISHFVQVQINPALLQVQPEEAAMSETDNFTHALAEEAARRKERAHRQKLIDAAQDDRAVWGTSEASTRRKTSKKSKASKERKQKSREQKSHKHVKVEDSTPHHTVHSNAEGIEGSTEATCQDLGKSSAPPGSTAEIFQHPGNTAKYVPDRMLEESTPSSPAVFAVQASSASAEAQREPSFHLDVAAETNACTSFVVSSSYESDVGESRVEKWTSIFNHFVDDGEVHTEHLLVALEMAGFPKPNATWVTEILVTLSEYSTLSLDEFIDFVVKYEAYEHKEAHKLFKTYDDDNSDSLDLLEVRELFESCGITPMSHVIKEIVREVGTKDPRSVSFDEFWQVLRHLRTHEGFTTAEVQNIKSMFSKFDHDKGGSLDTKELARVLCYMGFALPTPVVEDILHEVDVDGSGTIDEREFFVCMRKVREREVETMVNTFRECDTDGSGGIDYQELVTVLRTLGYYPERDEIRDASEDAGVKEGEEMDVEQLWRFIEAYRGREGFSKADVEELRDSFNQMDLLSGSKDGELDAFSIGFLFMKVGLPVNCTQIQRFVANVDIDASGTIDFLEFMKIARQLSEHISFKAHCAYPEFKEVSSTPTMQGNVLQETLEALMPVSYHSDVLEVAKQASVTNCAGLTRQKTVNHFEFISAVNQLRGLTRKQVKGHSGFGEAELAELQEDFTEYDHEHKGFLSGAQVQRLLESLFPDLATSASSRPQLLEIMEDATSHAAGAIDFAAFVRLMRKVSDLSEMDRIQRERSAIESVDFSVHEVNEFRELFLGPNDREFLSPSELKEMLSAIVPMGDKNTKALSSVFDRVVAERSGKRQADFSEFLLLLQHLMEHDVAGINELSQKVASASEQEHTEELARIAANEMAIAGAFKRRCSFRNNSKANSPSSKSPSHRH